MYRRMLMLVVAVFAVALALPFAVSAQEDTATVTITEDEINSSFRVTNPARARITNMVVDLQPDQVSLSYTYTVRAPRGSATTSYSVNAVYVPTVTNGRLYWTVSSVTANGRAASESLIDQINTSIETSWRNYIRRQIGTGRLASVTITDTEMIFTLG